MKFFGILLAIFIPIAFIIYQIDQYSQDYESASEMGNIVIFMLSSILSYKLLSSAYDAKAKKTKGNIKATPYVITGIIIPLLVTGILSEIDLFSYGVGVFIFSIFVILLVAVIIIMIASNL